MIDEKTRKADRSVHPVPRGSVHTLLTYGSIMVLVTMVGGPLGNPATERIVRNAVSSRAPGDFC